MSVGVTVCLAIQCGLAVCVTIQWGLAVCVTIQWGLAIGVSICSFHFGDLIREMLDCRI
jgi:hypothetical protein